MRNGSLGFVLILAMLCCDWNSATISPNAGPPGSGIRTAIDILKSKGPKEASADVLEAMKKCERAILKPKNDLMVKGPSYCLGLLKQSLGDLEGALEDYKRAIDRFPENGAAGVNAAGILENLGRDAEAEGFYRKSLLVNDTAEAAFSRLAPLLLRNNRDKEAKELCESFLKICSPASQYTAYEKLGATMHKMKQLNKAHEAYCSAYASCSEMDHAVTDSSMVPRLVEAMNNVALSASAFADVGGDLTHSVGSLRDKAEEFFLKSLALQPDNADTRTHYGVFLKYVNRLSEAAEQFRKALSVDPDEKYRETGYAKVQLASITGGTADTSMSKEYVRDLFNGYAERFDDELCGKLGYRGHEFVVSALRLAIERSKPTVSDDADDEFRSSTDITEELPQLSVVDIGCGTGLCGPLLRSFLSDCVLTGVDLSPQMITRAAARGCYNKLVVADAVEFLQSCTGGSVDAILAADVFIYIGALEKVFAAARDALKPGADASISATAGDTAVSMLSQGGFLVFTVEEILQETGFIGSSSSSTSTSGIGLGTTVGSDLSSVGVNAEGSMVAPDLLHPTGTGAGVRLLEVGRFGHSDAYIRSLAHRFGFEVLFAKRDVLRMQSGNPVRSRTYVLQRVA